MVQRNQVEMRSALLEMYQDQVMDNLVRSHLRLPTMQIAYSNATGTATNLNKATLTGGRTETENHFASAGTSALRVLLYSLSLTDELDTTNQMTLTANPVFNKEVSLAYQNFMAEEDAAKTQFLMSSPKMPPKGTYTAAYKFQNSTYYYIPFSNSDHRAADAFIRLYNDVAVVAPPKASTFLDQFLNEQTLQRLQQR